MSDQTTNTGPSTKAIWYSAIGVLLVGALIFYFFPYKQKAEFEDQCPTEFSKVPRLPVSVFTGRWTGKWDEKWTMSLEISPAAEEGGLRMKYSWEEKVGQPMSTQEFLTCVNGQFLVDSKERFKMSLKDDQHEAALLVGNFSKHTRYSNLTRQQVAESKN